MAPKASSAQLPKPWSRRWWSLDHRVGIFITTTTSSNVAVLQVLPEMPIARDDPGLFEEKALLALEPTSRIVPTTRTKINSP